MPAWSEENHNGRWRCYNCDELLKRDSLSLDLFWLRDQSITDGDLLPAPEVIAAEIVDDLEVALERFTKIVRASALSRCALVTGALYSLAPGNEHRPRVAKLSVLNDAVVVQYWSENVFHIEKQYEKRYCREEGLFIASIPDSRSPSDDQRDDSQHRERNEEKVRGNGVVYVAKAEPVRGFGHTTEQAFPSLRHPVR